MLLQCKDAQLHATLAATRLVQKLVINFTFPTYHPYGVTVMLFLGSDKNEIITQRRAHAGPHWLLTTYIHTNHNTNNAISSYKTVLEKVAYL